jgi:opacity protein-like surface antigen
MKMRIIIGASLALISTPALAETTWWGGASAGFNLDGGDVVAIARAGVDTTISEGAFVGLAIGAGESGLQECIGLACAIGGRELSAEVRLGGMSKSGLKYYGIAGYSNLTVAVRSGALNFGSVSDGGITGGVGLEAPLGSKVFTRVEYRYTDYGDFHVNSLLPTIGFKF